MTEPDINDRINEILEKNKCVAQIKIIQIEEYDWDMVDQLWLDFRMNNQHCKTIYPDVSGIEGRYMNLQFSDDLKMFSHTLFSQFIEEKELLFIVSANKKDMIFGIIKNPEGSKAPFFCLQMDNIYSNFMANEMLENQGDPTMKTLGIMMF